MDDRISAIANDEIPDAKDRLQYVIDKTETAANKTNGGENRMPDAPPKTFYASGLNHNLFDHSHK